MTHAAGVAHFVTLCPWLIYRQFQIHLRRELEKRAQSQSSSPEADMELLKTPTTMRSKAGIVAVFWRRRRLRTCSRG